MFYKWVLFWGLELKFYISTIKDRVPGHEGDSDKLGLSGVDLYVQLLLIRCLRCWEAVDICFIFLDVVLWPLWIFSGNDYQIQQNREPGQAWESNPCRHCRSSQRTTHSFRKSNPVQMQVSTSTLLIKPHINLISLLSKPCAPPLW